MVALIRDTLQEWRTDKAQRLAAALSYYTMFSLAPLLVIAVAIAGYFIGTGRAQAQVLAEIGRAIGPGAESFLRELLNNSARTGSGLLPTVIGLATLLFGASGVFGQLQEALNTIWEVEAEADQGILEMIKDRFLSFTMVLGAGFLLLASFLLSAALSTINAHFSELLPGSVFLWQVVNWIVSLGLITLLFALIFKVLPDVEIEWRDVWVGAGITAFLFIIGEFLIGLYLGRSGVVSTYGAAGSLVVILLWIYYSAQILFFGAEFTQVYASKYGSRIVPAEGAIWSELPSEYAVNQVQPQFEPGIPQTVGANTPSSPKNNSRLSQEPPVGGYVLIFLFGLMMGFVGLLWERVRRRT